MMITASDYSGNDGSCNFSVTVEGILVTSLLFCSLLKKVHTCKGFLCAQIINTQGPSMPLRSISEAVYSIHT